MTSTQKKRARPRGTGKDDSVALRKIADLILERPSIKYNTVIRQIAEPSTDAVLHRLGVKWRQSKVALMDEARRRRAAKEASATRQSPAYVPIGTAELWTNINALNSLLRSVEKWANPQFLERMSKMAKQAESLHQLTANHT